jgi:hypothetical protein
MRMPQEQERQQDRNDDQGAVPPGFSSSRVDSSGIKKVSGQQRMRGRLSYCETNSTGTTRSTIPPASSFSTAPQVEDPTIDIQSYICSLFQGLVTLSILHQGSARSTNENKERNDDDCTRGRIVLKHEKLVQEPAPLVGQQLPVPTRSKVEEPITEENLTNKDHGLEEETIKELSMDTQKQQSSVGEPVVLPPATEEILTSKASHDEETNFESSVTGPYAIITIQKSSIDERDEVSTLLAEEDEYEYEYESSSNQNTSKKTRFVKEEIRVPKQRVHRSAQSTNMNTHSGAPIKKRSARIANTTGSTTSSPRRRHLNKAETKAVTATKRSLARFHRRRLHQQPPSTLLQQEK